VPREITPRAQVSGVFKSASQEINFSKRLLEQQTTVDAVRSGWRCAPLVNRRGRAATRRLADSGVRGAQQRVERTGR
jgi:hypothetical protein